MENVKQILNEIMLLGCAPPASVDDNDLVSNIKHALKEELTSFKEEFITIIEEKQDNIKVKNTTSCANVVAPKPKLRGPSIVISSTQSKNHDDIIKIWKNSTSFMSRNFAPMSTKKLSNNKLVVEFETECR